MTKRQDSAKNYNVEISNREYVFSNGYIYSQFRVCTCLVIQILLVVKLLRDYYSYLKDISA